jgi:RimJ/RimL family protein N-acetyltransferase
MIESNRLILSTISTEDIENIHGLHSHPQVCEFSTTPVPRSLEGSRQIIEPFVRAQSDNPRKYFTFKIILKDKGDFAGIAGLTLSLDKYRSGEIFYEVLPDLWNKGYATEVVVRLIKFGFNELALHRIEANTDTDNTGSVRVLEKSGMAREGMKRHYLPVNGKWKDGYLYSITEFDYLLL